MKEVKGRTLRAVAVSLLFAGASFSALPEAAEAQWRRPPARQSAPPPVRANPRLVAQAESQSGDRFQF
jgi:hypothetical protein